MSDDRAPTMPEGHDPHSDGARANRRDRLGKAIFDRSRGLSNWFAHVLGDWYVLLLVVLVVVGLAVLLWLPGALVGGGSFATSGERIVAENGIRATIAQIMGGGALIGGLFLTARNVRVAQDNVRVSQENVRVAEEGKVTDRYAKAIEQLGSDTLTVRLGGIYALERISKDSPKDYNTVMEVLSAFVREKAPVEYEADGTLTEVDEVENRTPTDIQAALAVIGRRQCPIGLTEARINLRSIRAVGVQLERASLPRVDMRLADLRGAKLYRANLDGADLGGADLERADLSHASLTSAQLNDTCLARTFMEGAQMERADLEGADLSGANLDGANLKAAYLNGAQLLLTTLNGAFLNGASLDGAQMEVTLLGGVHLEGANLTYAKYGGPKQFANVHYDDKTVFPEEVAEWLRAHKNAGPDTSPRGAEK